MNIIAVDDEQYALTGLKSAILEALSNNKSSSDLILSCFNNSEDALEYAKTNRVDTAFLDIEMSGMNGLFLAKQLKDLYGRTNIVFVTGHSQYAVDAFALRAKGYIMKPFTAKAVREAIEHLQDTVSHTDNMKTLAPTSEKRLHVKTFGNFEIFVDGNKLKFDRTKTKELFAYLISRKGAGCNNNEIAAILWENKEDSNSLQTMFRQLVVDLTQRLEEAGMQEVLIKERGSLAIAVEKISCDFYDFCDGINVNDYMGEFMNQYSWAEFTNTYLDRIYKKY
jgi:two-component SAPR family response regulator